MNPYEIALGFFIPALMVAGIAIIVSNALGLWYGLGVIAFAIVGLVFLYIIGTTMQWLDDKSQQWEKDHSR